MTLPEKFTLIVEHKPGPPGDFWWVVRCPEQPGFYLAAHDLETILEDVPVSLSALIEADAGVSPAQENK